ncbi:MAG: alpha-L-fucosidase [Verrucomicrobiota bacterium]
MPENSSLRIPRPLPRIARFEKLGFGLFLHWGLYSLQEQGEWVRFLLKIDEKKYRSLMGKFEAEAFSGRKIAAWAKSVGIRYIVLTTRHHDGFSLYDTCGLSTFDAPHSAAKRDLVADFVEGCRAEGIIPFFYHTTIDWTWDFELKPQPGKWFSDYLHYFHQSVEILCKNYGKIGGLWFDGNWAYPHADWKEDRLYKIIRKHQPDAIIVNNTGLHHRGKQGHPEVDSVTYEQSLPGAINRRGLNKYIAGEMCQTFNGHWGIGGEDFNYISPAKVIENLSLCRKVGANYLFNIGPTAAGEIPPYEKTAMNVVGRWMNHYSEAIREGKPCEVAAPGQDFILQGKNCYYYFAFELPVRGNEAVTVGSGNLMTRAIQNFPVKIKQIQWMDSSQKLPFTQDLKNKIAAVQWNGYEYGRNHVVRVAKIDI